MRRTHLWLLHAILLAVLGDAVAADPPARVARLAYLRGSVSFSPAGADDWTGASLNRPVVTGDRIWTEPGARDELQLGPAALRMGGGTLVNVLNLDDQLFQLQLTQGALSLRVRPGAPAGVIEVDTPNLALVIQQPGHYRIDVDPSGQATVVRVTDGQAQAYGPATTFAIGPGQAYRFLGNDLRNMQYADARGRDDLDRWSQERDRRASRSLAARYVSPAVVGYEDLDDYGDWRTVDGYGPVWMPARVARDWAPYRDGHWAWVEPWGWTWVDDAPWGFVVSHYGRWANFGGNWGWVPGPRSAMPVYAPALVMFVDTLGAPAPRRTRGPAVAWFPLAPQEPYRPPYPVSQRYVTNINVTNYAQPAGGYRNRAVPGAVTAVPAAVFARAQPVRRATIPLPQQVLTGAPLAAAAPVQARRESLANRLTAGHRPAPAALARPVMVHTTPPAARRPTLQQPAMPQALAQAAPHTVAPPAARPAPPTPPHAPDIRNAPQGRHDAVPVPPQVAATRPSPPMAGPPHVVDRDNGPRHASTPAAQLAIRAPEAPPRSRHDLPPPAAQPPVHPVQPVPGLDRREAEHANLAHGHGTPRQQIAQAPAPAPRMPAQAPAPHAQPAAHPSAPQAQAPHPQPAPHQMVALPAPARPQPQAPQIAPHAQTAQPHPAPPAQAQHHEPPHQPPPQAAAHHEPPPQAASHHEPPPHPEGAQGGPGHHGGGSKEDKKK